MRGAMGLAAAVAAAALHAAPVAAQAMPGMDMPGMDMSGHHAMAMPPAAPTAPAHNDAHAAPEHTAAPVVRSGTDLAPPEQGAPPPPPPPMDHAADAVWGADAMQAARRMVHHEHGGMRMHQILFNLAEAQVRRGRDGYRWDAEGWWGGDVHRLVLKSEGEGAFGGRTDAAEVQALYSRAIGPYFDLQGGVRQDLGAGPKRSYAAVGIEGLAPYWFETEASLFLSDKGDVLGRAEAWYDQRITQRLVLQPRAELNFAAQDVAEQRIGRGLSTAELGLRLRYELRRELAPYVGVSWDRKIGRTGDYARAAGEGRGGAAAVVGVRTWF
jgi:copper resistance protein B